jgi:deoxyhypusine synthase
MALNLPAMAKTVNLDHRGTKVIHCLLKTVDLEVPQMKIKGPEIEPRPMPTQLSITHLVDEYMPAFNGARLREACQLLVGKILKPEVTVGLSISGALTPAGFGISVLAPLIHRLYRQHRRQPLP